MLGPTSAGRVCGMRLLEKTAYLVATVGILGDHLSTRLGLTNPDVYEANPYTIWLMQRGNWLTFDLLLLMATVGIPALIMRRWTSKGRWVILTFPALLGSTRLCVAIWNLIQYLS